MGDISAEPSMEDILSSIKRIIAEENDAPARARRATPRPVPRTEPFGHDEVLELNDPAPDSAREPEAQAPAAPPAPVTATAPVAEAPAEAIVSPHAVEATRGPLDALSRLVVKPEVSGSDTLEGLVREMLRPMLREWLDAHLPTMVEQMVAREIDRITSK